MILIVALWEWRQLDLASLRRMLPASPAFWVTYTIYYLLVPAADWIIYRRLWRLPFSGIIPLLRKKVSNEMVLGYLGELYLLSWVRRHTDLAVMPFGSIKDVAVLSAMAGNVITLLMLALGFPLLIDFFTGPDLDISQRSLAISAVIMCVGPVAVFFMRHHVLTLQYGQLKFIMTVHCARIVAGILLLALMWHLALPRVDLYWWVVLAMLRQLVSRLPFTPNKDIIFASVAIVLVGDDQSIQSLMALVAAIVLLTHIVVGAATASIEIFENSNRK